MEECRSAGARQRVADGHVVERRDEAHDGHVEITVAPLADHAVEFGRCANRHPFHCGRRGERRALRGANVSERPRGLTRERDPRDPGDGQQREAEEHLEQRNAARYVFNATH